MEKETLVVVGAGPKAMALVAKAAVLEDLGWWVPRIAVVERKEVGANWTGRSGYTNGSQPLGTSPEKDLGFPYDSPCWGEATSREVNARMLRWSWQAFQVARGRYGDWIDRGRPTPLHQDWAAYLAWIAAEHAGRFELVLGEVEAISVDGEQWVVKTPEASLRGEGLVVTGPGQVRLPSDLPEHPQILTIETFWRVADRFEALEDQRIAIVGTGETAAAVAIALVEGDSRGIEVDIYSPVGMAYSRGESYRENRVYTDPDQGNWWRLTPRHRRDFIRRTDRGVFSQDANRVLDKAGNLQILPGRLVAAEEDPGGGIRAHFEYHGDAHEEVYDTMILATGADHLALLEECMDPAGKEWLLEASGLTSLAQDRIEESVEGDLGLRGLNPRLHLPMLSGLVQGPGFSNLSCLGRLSDRILETYVVEGGRA